MRITKFILKILPEKIKMKYNHDKLLIKIMVVSFIVLIVAGGMFGMTVVHLIKLLNT